MMKRTKLRNSQRNIQVMLKGIVLDSSLTADTREFVISLKRYFERKKYLSDKQFKCLKEIYMYQQGRKAEQEKKKERKQLF